MRGGSFAGEDFLVGKYVGGLSVGIDRGLEIPSGAV